MKTEKLRTLLLSIFILLFASCGCSQAPSQQKETKIVTSKTIDKRRTGLRVYKPEKCFTGYTLYSTLPMPSSGRPGRNSLYPIHLIDMKAQPAHTWYLGEAPSVSFSRLAEDGNLYFVSNDIPSKRFPEATISGLRELDPQSNELWFYPGFIQHDFQILPGGKFLIERDEVIDVPEGYKSTTEKLISPRKEIIDRSGKVHWSWKAEDHVKELETLAGVKEPFLNRWTKERTEALPKKETAYPYPYGGYYSRENISTLYPKGDWAHSNTCEILSNSPLAKKDKRFRPGNMIFSYPTLDVIGVIDYPSGKIVWAWGPGELDGQHTPTLLDNGNLLIFDNGIKRGWSRVIELDPLTEKIVWEYHAQPKESFYSSLVSNAERLPNGNTLICEGFSERIFEITPEGEVVWDYISTTGRTTGGLGIYRAYRYSPEYTKPLFERSKKDT